MYCLHFIPILRPGGLHSMENDSVYNDVCVSYVSILVQFIRHNYDGYKTGDLKTNETLSLRRFLPFSCNVVIS